MSPQETQALQDFLNQLTQVRGIAKDPQANALIASAVAQQPDAAYLLVQRALLMEQALTTSKAQIASLQNQLQAAQSAAAPARGFLDGNSWGSTPAPANRPAPVSATAYAPPAPAYTGAPMPAQAPQYQAAPAPAPSSGFFGGGIGSTLGAVAATAAGVAGGAFLFQGIEHLMNSGSSGSSLMHSGGGNMPTETVENTTINNYYSSDSEPDSGNGNGSDSGSDRSRDRDDSRWSNVASNDILDDSSANYSDSSDSSDSSSFDDSMA